MNNRWVFWKELDLVTHRSETVDCQKKQKVLNTKNLIVNWLDELKKHLMTGLLSCNNRSHFLIKWSHVVNSEFNKTQQTNLSHRTHKSQWERPLNPYTSGSSYEKLLLFEYKSSPYIPLRQTNIINKCKHGKASLGIIVYNFDLHSGVRISIKL